MQLDVSGPDLRVRETLALNLPAGSRKGEPVTDAALGLPLSGSDRGGLAACVLRETRGKASRLAARCLCLTGLDAATATHSGECEQHCSACWEPHGHETQYAVRRFPTG